jgi:hypothetical protein
MTTNEATKAEFKCIFEYGKTKKTFYERDSVLISKSWDKFSAGSFELSFRRTTGTLIRTITVNGHRKDIEKLIIDSFKKSGIDQFKIHCYSHGFIYRRNFHNCDGLSDGHRLGSVNVWAYDFDDQGNKVGRKISNSAL